MVSTWLVLFLVGGGRDAYATPNHVDICHKGKELAVNQNAVAAHLRHGDTLPGSWFSDADADGFGDASTGVTSCDQPSGAVDNGADCNDAEPDVYPGATEVCNDVDDDCDGAVDDDATDAAAWFPDVDQDGYGGGGAVFACSAPDGYTDVDDDCDDTEPETYPLAPETCGDGVDQDCDGSDEVCPVECGDLDCDGLPDLVVMNYGTGNVATDSRAFLTADNGGLSATSFVALPTFRGRRAIAEDLDGDGLKDLVVVGDCTDATCTSSVPAIYWNSPTGLSTANRTDLPLDRSSLDACVGDLDADGLPDIVIANNGRGSNYAVNSTILYGVHGYAVQVGLPTRGAFRCAIADLDADGDDDLAFAGWYDGDWNTESRVFWNDGGFSPTDFDALPTNGARGLDVADYNGDGFLDVALPGFRDNGDHFTATFVYYGSAVGFSTSDRDAVNMTGAHDLRSADLDGDGWLDLVVPSLLASSGTSTNTTSYVFWGSASGFSNADSTPLPMWAANDVAIADLDGDGWRDLAFANERRQQIGMPTTFLVDSTIWWGGPSGFSGTDTLLLPTPGASQVRASDLDLDGHLDLVFASYFDTDSTTETSVYWGAPGGAYTASDRTLLPSAGTIGLTVVGP